MYLKIVGKDKEYIGTLIPISDNVIKVEGLPKTTAGLYLYLNDKYERVIGDYTKYTTVYRIVDADNNIYEYSNDGSKYVEPVIEEPVIEEPQVHVRTIEEARTAKIAYVKDQSEYAIRKGEVVTLSDGSQDEFNYSQFNQMNIANAFNLAISTKEAVPYYDSENICKIYSAEDIIRIYISCQTLVTYHLTLAHQLIDQINKNDDVEAVDALEYNIEALDAEHLTIFNEMMAQAQKLVAKVTQ